MSMKDWPTAMRKAGLDVSERPGWFTNRPLGSLDEILGVYEHHDASPPGSSPGAYSWITSSYDSKQPSAQLWLDYFGKYFFIGGGKAYHAGTCRGPLGFNNSVGVEIDHTTGEAWPAAQTEARQKGMAVICYVEGRNASFITFHKIEAIPRGRKQDPDFGTLDESKWQGELDRERGAIQNYINQLRKNNGVFDASLPKPPVIDPDKDWFDMATAADLRQIVREEVVYRLPGIVNDVVAGVLRSGEFQLTDADQDARVHEQVLYVIRDMIKNGEFQVSTPGK